MTIRETFETAIRNIELENPKGIEGINDVGYAIEKEFNELIPQDTKWGEIWSSFVAHRNFNLIANYKHESRPIVSVSYRVHKTGSVRCGFYRDATLYLPNTISFSNYNMEKILDMEINDWLNMLYDELVEYERKTEEKADKCIEENKNLIITLIDALNTYSELSYDDRTTIRNYIINATDNYQISRYL